MNTPNDATRNHRTTRDHAPGDGAPPAPKGRRRGAKTALLFLLLAAPSGVALATEGESYPTYGDAATEALIDAFEALIQRVEPSLCTGTTWSTGSESTRAANEGTPLVEVSHPLGGDRTDGAGQLEKREGDDTDVLGSDRYLYVKLVGTRASVFCKVVLEAEDGATSAWSVRYRGDETLAYRNGPILRAEELTVSNPWAIGWSRRVVDFDAVNGEYDEAKAIDQRFAVKCELIDGSSAGDGRDFTRAVPATQSATTSVGLKLKAGTKVGTSPGAEYGAELGFEASTTETYDTKFHELTDESAPLSGVATVSMAVPCPYENDWTAATSFDGDFSIHDHADINGDKGSRQELLLTVLNYIASIRVEKCHECGTGAPPTPRDPTGPNTPTDPPPAEPPSVVTPPTGPATTVDESETDAARGAVLTPPIGQEPGWGGTPPSTPGADPARGPESTSSD